MDRLACVSLPWFPLQILLHRQPSWRSAPVAVVSRDEPSGELLWVNEPAWRARVRPGLRYSAALSICRELRAAEVSEQEIEEKIIELCEPMKRLSPAVEASRSEPGVFWLDASGLRYLYPQLEDWAAALRQALTDCGFDSNVAVGFHRFATYALACTPRAAGTVIFNQPEQERSAAAAVELERLGVDAAVLRSMGDLAVVTVADFLALPAAAIRRRFGSKAALLRELAEERTWTPFHREPNHDLPSRHLVFEEAVINSQALVFAARGLLDSLLQELAEQSRALVALVVEFELDHPPLSPSLQREEELSPAEPTLNSALILELLRLRLEGPNHGGQQAVTELTLKARSVPASSDQLRLFAEKPRRDLDAANRALARLRAEFGNDAVVVAKLCSMHLPEAHFRWEPLTTLGKAAPRLVQRPPLVRRIYDRPSPVSLGDLQGSSRGSLQTLAGPHIISGGWWQQEVEREYYFATTDHSELLWVYYDRNRDHWFLQGRVD